MVIRYADNLVAICHSQRQAQEVKARIAEWLAPRGLTFNEGKTRIVHIDDGYNCLGFNIRQYRGQATDQAIEGGHPATPGTASHRVPRSARELTRWRSSPRSTPSSGAGLPTTGAWSASRTFARGLDNHLWALSYKWATFRHRQQAEEEWIVARYFGEYNKFRNDHWVFGDAASGAHLVKFSWNRHRPAHHGQRRGIPGSTPP